MHKTIKLNKNWALFLSKEANDVLVHLTCPEVNEDYRWGKTIDYMCVPDKCQTIVPVEVITKAKLLGLRQNDVCVLPLVDLKKCI